MSKKKTSNKITIPERSFMYKYLSMFGQGYVYLGYDVFELTQLFVDMLDHEEKLQFSSEFIKFMNSGNNNIEFKSFTSKNSPYWPEGCNIKEGLFKIDLIVKGECKLKIENPMQLLFFN